MKLKRFISAFTSVVLGASLFVSNAVFASAEDNYILTDKDVTASNWGQAITINDPIEAKKAIKEGCTVVVEYTGGTVEFVLQSWTDPNGQVWAQVTPDKTADGVATFSYESIKKKFIDTHESDWEYLDAIHVGVGADETTIHKAYITYGEDSAEKEPEKEDEKKPATSEDKNIPTISFDAKAWTNYVKLTPDASLAGIKLDQITTDSYQATSLVVNANLSGALDGKWPAYAASVNDEDGNPMYPDAFKASENEVEGAFVRMGFELSAADFGLENFNGCTFEFYHLFNEAAYDALLNNAMYIYPVTDLYETTSVMPKLLKVDTLTRENIDFYKKDFIAVTGLVEGQSPVTKLLFEIPFMKGYQGEVLRMDNIKITLPDGSVVANVDSYNSTFKPRNESDGKIKPGSASTVEEEDDAPKKKDTKKDDKGGFNPIIILIVVLVIGAVGLVVVILLKNKNRYY